MNEPTLHDVLAAIGRVEMTQGQHSVALLEVTGDLKHIRGTLAEHSVLLGQHTALLGQHTATLREHSQSLDRIERRQRTETKSLDEQDARIKKLERRRKSGRAPES
jgi:hypothetical protein